MPPQALIRVRLSARDARAETGQVDPMRLLELFNDIASELAIREVGDEGLLRAYATFDVLGPLRVGDYIEARGRIVDTGRKSLTVEFVAHKVIRAARTVENPMGGALIDPPRLIGRATGVWLIPERAAVGDEVAASEAAEAGEAPAAAEEGAEEAPPMSWGGHRPADAPREKRRPGATVRMRPDDPDDERPPRQEREEDEERYWRDRSDERRGGYRGGGGGREGSRPYNDRPRDDRGRGGSRPYSDRPRDDRPRGGSRPYSDRPRDNRPRDDRPRGGSRPYSDRPRDDRPRDDRGRGGSRPYSDRPRDDRPRGGSRSYSDRPRDDRPRDDRPRDDRPRDDRPRDDRPRDDRPRDDRPRNDRPPKREDSGDTD